MVALSSAKFVKFMSLKNLYVYSISDRVSMKCLFLYLILALLQLLIRIIALLIITRLKVVNNNLMQCL